MTNIIQKFKAQQKLKKFQEGGKYQSWLNLSWKDKIKRNLNIYKSYLDKGPNISNIYNAGKAILGGFNPTNTFVRRMDSYI